MPHLVSQGPRPVFGAITGLVGVAAVNVLFVVFDPNVTRAVPLLLLLVPVTVAGVIGGWRGSVPIALVTGLAYSFHFIAPIGAIRLGFTEDTVSTLTFIAVAIFISEIGRRRDARRAERERQRSVLLRSVSHDLRNPLSTIRTASAELRSGAITDPLVRSHLLDLVVDEADRLERIITNLLSLTRIEAGALAPDRAPESLAEIIDASVSRLERAHGGIRPRRIAVEVPVDLPHVMVDRVQVDQVVTNLIENALRHGVGSHVITVTAVASPGSVSVAVADDGPGFSLSFRARPFGFFEPAGPTGAEGIGLAVCKAIVEAHGGSITADDRPEGGARVAFSLPTA